VLPVIRQNVRNIIYFTSLTQYGSGNTHRKCDTLITTTVLTRLNLKSSAYWVVET